MFISCDSTDIFGILLEVSIKWESHFVSIRSLSAALLGINSYPGQFPEWRKLSSGNFVMHRNIV
uniref:Uncharacterized protein n=1 Tax=Ascaris lumbricoides TaxID=6252 RepID=A0A0M3IIQ5_ASCLU